MPSDLIYRMYMEYDPDKIETTLPKQLELWIRDYLS